MVVVVVLWGAPLLEGGAQWHTEVAGTMECPSIL